MKLSNFPPETRVWVYQADRVLNETEKNWLGEQIDAFTAGWASHGTQLCAAGEVYNDFTVILAVDTSKANSSGCSIDKSVHFMKEAGKALGTDFFNRLKTWIKQPDGSLERVSFKSLADYPETLAYNTTVQNLGEFREKYEIRSGDLLDQFAS
jgi:hypothetical protein